MNFSYFFLFFFLPHHGVCRILVLKLGADPMPPTLGAQSLPIREVPLPFFSYFLNSFSSFVAFPCKFYKKLAYVYKKKNLCGILIETASNLDISLEMSDIFTESSNPFTQSVSMFIWIFNFFHQYFESPVDKPSYILLGLYLFHF